MQESLSAAPRPGYPLARYALPVALVCVVHAAVLALLWRAAPVSAAAPQVLDVVMISAPVLEAAPPAPVPPPKPEPVKPKLEPVKPKPEPVLREPAPKPVPQAVPEPAPAPVAPPPAAVAPSATPVEAPPVVIPPRVDASYRGNFERTYPLASRKLREEGTVRLRIYVRTDGSVGDVVLVKSSGFSRLDRAAMQDVKRWKLIPARQGNEPVAAWYDAPVEYKME